MRRLILIALLPICGLIQAQTWTPRVNFGARLEPKGVIVHGAGQEPPDFAAYWNTMPVGRQPQVYMWYQDLDTMSPGWTANLKAQLQAYPGSFLIPQIGVSLTNGANAHYEADVAAGKYDTQIANLVSGLRALATPVYLRIGYEFNGVGWNGYLPAPYAQAFIRIAKALRAAPDIEVATVWDAEVDGATDFMDYYPGDDYVDWFGMNIFNGTSFSNPILPTFMSLADAHKKPVMIGETTPVGVGAQQGSTSWTQWFAPFFGYLQATPEIKEFNYIDCDWSTTQWPTWGDSRLQLDTAAPVRSQYIAQLGDPAVLSGASESAFRKLLGYNNATPPPAVSDLKASVDSNGVVTLTWTPVTDPSGIARYYIYRNGTLLDFTLAPPYTDTSAVAGTPSYGIAAMDRAGNLSAVSPAQSLALSQVQTLVNGGFENGTLGWTLENDAATVCAGTLTADTTNPIDGTASGAVTVSKSDGTNWHLQVEQYFQMTKGLTYTISFKTRASASVQLPLMIQQNGGAYTVYYQANFTASPTVASYQHTLTATDTQPVKLSYEVAAIGSVTLWLDDVSVVESLGTANPPPDLLASGVTSGASFLPAIAPGGWVAIKGGNLAQVASDTWDKSIVSGKLPTSLDGVGVSVGGQPAYVYYVSPGQINAVVPNIAAGQTTLSVTTPTGQTGAVAVNVGTQAPAFFLWPGNQAVATRQDGSYAVKAGTFSGATTAAAHPGDVIVLWGTGFGATTPAVASGILTPSDKLYNCDPVTATLGGAAVTVYGCALSPGWAALYQVAIQVPSTLAAGDYALKVVIDNASSPDGVILSIAP
jgi:uncharacterized protein (TIGR03437 family)